MKNITFNAAGQHMFSDKRLAELLRDPNTNFCGPALEELYLSSTGVTAIGLQTIEAPNLKVLEIGNGCIDNSVLAVIASRFPKLKSLTLSRSQVSGDFSELSALPISWLDLNHCPNVSDESIDGIAKISTLECLLIECTSVRRIERLNLLLPLLKLRRLDLRGLGMTQLAVDSFASQRTPFKAPPERASETIPAIKVAGGEYTQPQPYTGRREKEKV